VNGDKEKVDDGGGFGGKFKIARPKKMVKQKFTKLAQI